MQEQIITVAVGLGILGVSYLVDLLASLANVTGDHTADTFSWKKLWSGLKGALLWAMSCIGLTIALNLMAWFTEKLGVKLGDEFEGVSVVALLGLVVGASGAYLINAFGNVKFYIQNRGGVLEVDTTEANPDYDGIAKEVKEFADKITPDWIKNEKQTSAPAEKEAEAEEIEVGLGAGTPLSRRLKDGNNDGGKGWQCSKYSYYLATGVRMNYKPHPDYGPCNGNQMVNYLVSKCGYVRCKKEKGAIFAYNAGQYGHTGMVLDPKKNIVNDANWTPLKVSTHYLNLEAVGAVYCKPKAAAKPATKKKTNEQIAREVIAGKWGNGADRKKKLQKAGYNPTAIQKIVNRLLGY